MTAGRRDLLGMGTAAASAGAAGPSQGLRAGWSSGRTEAGVHRGERDHAPSGAGRRPGLGARLLATSDEARAGWFVNDQFERFFLSQLAKLGTDEATFESAVTISFFESIVQGS